MKEKQTIIDKIMMWFMILGNGLTKHKSYHIGIGDCITIIRNRKLKLES